MKKIIIILLATAPALFAADTNTTALATSTNAISAPQVDLAEQAQLVMEIGQDAARDFNPELHARSLRAQIESLVSVTKPAVATPAEPSGTLLAQPEAACKPTARAGAAPASVAADGDARPDAAVLHETAVKLRALAHELEVQIGGGAGKQ